MQDYSITHNIPVADHVYKYLVKRCGTAHIKAGRSNFMGSIILSLLSKNLDVRFQKRNFSKLFKVDISESYYEKNGMHITPATAQLFNDQVDKMFREELYIHMLMLRNQDNKMFIHSMRRFLEVYDINEDDIKMDTLLRDFKRKKDTLELNLNLTSTSGTI